MNDFSFRKAKENLTFFCLNSIRKFKWQIKVIPA